MVTANKVIRNQQVSNSMGTSMLLQAQLLILGIFTLHLGSAFAGSRPQIPEPSVDLKLTKGVPVEQFFAERLKDQQCQSQLQTTRQE